MEVDILYSILQCLSRNHLERLRPTCKLLFSLIRDRFRDAPYSMLDSAMIDDYEQTLYVNLDPSCRIEGCDLDHTTLSLADECHAVLPLWLLQPHIRAR